MIENTRERNYEFGWYALAFGLALAFRLVRLGELPLGDAEAGWALQAFNLVKGLHPGIGAQPAYVLLTAFVFFVLQASNFAARLVPAVFGAALCLVPYQFKKKLGNKPAIVLAFFLALDPGFLALSRLAGSPIIAVAAVLFCLGAWLNNNPRPAGIWSGVALLGGPQTWPGVLSIVIGWGLFRGLIGDSLPEGDEDIPESKPVRERKDWIDLLGYGAGTYLILGSFFLLVSGSLGAGLSSIQAYFGGWFTPSGVPASRLLIGLTFYEFLPILLAAVGLIRSILRRDETGIGLGLWLAASLVLVLMNPARQMMDLAWVLFPLLALAAREAAHYLVPIQEGTWETIGMTVFTAALLIFAGLNYSAIALVPMEAVSGQLRWWILLGSIGLLLVSIVMVAFGWSQQTAVQGGLWGGLIVLVFYTLSMSMASGGLRTVRTFEMWPTSANIGQVETLVSQMDDLSRFKQGINSDLDVTIAGINSPALLWALRDWPLTVLPEANLAGSTPSVVISSDQFAKTEVESVYRGQDLDWRVYPAWDQGLPADWLRWSLLHDFPTIKEKIILWVRSDVFIDSQNLQK